MGLLRNSSQKYYKSIKLISLHKNLRFIVKH